MALYDDREHYREAVMEQPHDDRVCDIAKEMDRLSAFAGDGKMFRMQVAGVIHAARCCGWVLTPAKMTVYDGTYREVEEAETDTGIRKS